jgi:peptide/nickel transport system substrate-binding protein
LAIFASIIALGVKLYYANTHITPSLGGTHIEAALGIPRFVNPVLSQISDSDRDISRLVYASLMKYTKEGKLIPDLVESYAIEGDTIYTFKLKNNIFWHDGQIVTADDVVFTVKLIQDPKYASPIRLNWQGVEVEKVDDLTVRFKLTNPYSPFLENTTVGILPRHIWDNISPKSFPLAEANLQPIGSGPYKFEKFQKDSAGNIKSYSLKINDKYYSPAHIERIVFKFFDSEKEALDAFKKNEVTAMSFVSGYNSAQIPNASLYKFSLPRYFAVFLNQTKSEVLAQKEVREALAFATDRDQIIDISAGGMGTPSFGPIVPGLLGYNPQIEEKYKFSLDRAIEILEKQNWLDTDGDGIREKKLNEETTPLLINLTTVEWPELERVMRVLKEQWKKIGVEVTINAYTLGELQQEHIRPREYEALLFGQLIGIDPDPFSFWHSSQKKDPGLNLSLYDNKTADKLLEEARQTLDSQSREEKYLLFQETLTNDIPAIFLYNPSYIYPVNDEIKGISEGKISDPSWRFANVDEWYIDTKRVWR